MTTEPYFVHVGDIARQMVMDFAPAAPAPGKPTRSKPAKISPIIGDCCWRMHPVSPDRAAARAELQRLYVPVHLRQAKGAGV